ncbi:hypothetical protein [Asticcacaulis sp. YBE204]|uniref:hypothetical protein n=1 Tax=Asticcacaulis sp. YBE204 TaxID=1282363 RepID=UPI0003C40E77|nr:hypothetical protein [Asticcacaulis sp. YBE204]ESQ79556.1 hypothetical protein AEYBE204_06860 [Asticcacaulis sp. YBE204]
MKQFLPLLAVCLLSAPVAAHANASLDAGETHTRSEAHEAGFGSDRQGFRLRLDRDVPAPMVLAQKGGCSVDQAIDMVVSQSRGTYVSASRSGNAVIVKVKIDANIVSYRVDLGSCSVSRM